MLSRCLEAAIAKEKSIFGGGARRLDQIHISRAYSFKASNSENRCHTSHCFESLRATILLKSWHEQVSMYSYEYRPHGVSSAVVMLNKHTELG